jgi:hypothetical protein
MSQFYPTRIYGQKDALLIINGRQIYGFMDGAPFKIQFDGGEVAKTEGTDGPGLNIATSQGGTFHFTVRESSPDYDFLLGIFALESDTTGVTVAATFVSGGQMVFDMPRCLLGLPGELSTGDKKQGGTEFMIIGDSITGTAPSL